jgi:hypothetical protein
MTARARNAARAAAGKVKPIIDHGAARRKAQAKAAAKGAATSPAEASSMPATRHVSPGQFRSASGSYTPPSAASPVGSRPAPASQPSRQTISGAKHAGTYSKSRDVAGAARNGSESYGKHSSDHFKRMSNV